MFKIYSSMQKEKVPFVPLHPGKVGIYACGVTVYDRCHLGHARTSVAVDILVRYLRHRGFQVLYVRNVTDIDDKIIQRAQKLSCSVPELTTTMTREMHEDFQALNLLSPDAEPRATEYIDAMQSMIASLMEQGFAYQAASGDIYFRVKSYPDYGKLSGQKTEALQASFRVSDAHKEGWSDFVLWKKVTEADGAPLWESPWGAGRPGWHIECSAMSKSLIGKTVDIHAGGCDLKFPHHENEQAQSVCANKAPFVNHWMHVGMVTVHSEKMSKSLENFIELRYLSERFGAEVVRCFLMQSHYRSLLDFNEKNLALAQNRLESFYGALSGLEGLASMLPTAAPSNWSKAFFDALDDDLNTPLALSTLSALASEIFKLKQQKANQEARQLGAELKRLSALLGLLSRTSEDFFQGKADFDFAAQLEARHKAREAQDWALADKIRKELEARGVQLEDRVDGTTEWKWVFPH